MSKLDIVRFFHFFYLKRIHKKTIYVQLFIMLTVRIIISLSSVNSLHLLLSNSCQLDNFTILHFPEITKIYNIVRCYNNNNKTTNFHSNSKKQG